jgi:hypothetical protein
MRSQREQLAANLRCKTALEGTMKLPRRQFPQMAAGAAALPTLTTGHSASGQPLAPHAQGSLVQNAQAAVVALEKNARDWLGRNPRRAERTRSELDRALSSTDAKALNTAHVNITCGRPVLGGDRDGIDLVYSRAPFDLMPVDLFAYFKLRRDMQLPEVSVAHPLLSTPLARIPEQVQLDADDLLARLSEVEKSPLGSETSDLSHYRESNAGHRFRGQSVTRRF